MLASEEEPAPQIPSYLVVDDAPSGARLADALRAHGHRDVELAGGREQALAEVTRRDFDRAAVSVRLGGRADGFRLTRELRQVRPRLRVILLSDYLCIEGFRGAIAVGAIDLMLRSHDVPHLQHAFARPERTWFDARVVPLVPPTLVEAEWQHLEAALVAAGGDPVCAAAWLGVDEATLKAKLEAMPTNRWSREIHLAVQRLSASARAR